MIPTAALMGRATEELAARSGPGIGGLLNVTFGNAPELIIALFALNKGLQEVVKASLVGSILGNILLVMGAAMFVGGWGRERQRFDRDGGQRAGADAAAGRRRARDARRSSSSSRAGAARARAPSASTTAATSSTCRWPVAVVLLLHLRRRAVLLAARPTATSSTPPHAEDEDEGEPWTVRRP